MAHYRTPPGDPDALPIVVATPEEVHALAPAIERSFEIRRVPSKDIPDLVQDVEIVTWRALEDERVRGYPNKSPLTSLRIFMRLLARSLASNYKLLARNRREFLVEPTESGETPILDPSDGRDLNAQIEARDLLAKLASYQGAALVLLGAVLDEPRQKRAEEGETNVHTESSRLTRARAWLRRSIETGKWRKPPQAVSPRPHRRKRKR